jgi:hypothetical protein
MTYFLNTRTSAVGGDVASDVTVLQVTNIEISTPANPNPPPPDVTIVPAANLVRAIAGKNVLLGTHGFKVSQPDGILSLGNWGERLLQLSGSSIFVGILWPGDSAWLGALSYPAEGQHAMQAGNLLWKFIDATFFGAASVALASHSLGARVLLQTVAGLSTHVKQITLMAGAINDDCLVKEYAGAAQKVSRISILASAKDEVLAAAFPIGNIFEGIIDSGHPYWDSAIGRKGPSAPIPSSIQGPWQIPNDWNYGHHHYIEKDPPPDPPFSLPQDVPAQGTPPPRPAAWQPAWSAALVSTRAK